MSARLINNFSLILFIKKEFSVIILKSGNQFALKSHAGNQTSLYLSLFQLGGVKYRLEYFWTFKGGLWVQD